jgi:hypothetical protein
VGWLYIALLAAAVILVAGAEWPRLEERFGGEPRRRRRRAKRKASLRLVRNDEADEFAASVERDLANLPTIDDREKRRR